MSNSTSEFGLPLPLTSNPYYIPLIKIINNIEIALKTNNLANRFKTGRIIEFLPKLYCILSEPLLSNIIEWCGDDHHALEVKNINHLIKYIFPYIYKAQRIDSFWRQLNMYSFTRVKFDPCQQPKRIVWKHDELHQFTTMDQLFEFQKRHRELKLGKRKRSKPDNEERDQDSSDDIQEAESAEVGPMSNVYCGNNKGYCKESNVYDYEDDHTYDNGYNFNSEYEYGHNNNHHAKYTSEYDYEYNYDQIQLNNASSCSYSNTSSIPIYAPIPINIYQANFLNNNP